MQIRKHFMYDPGDEQSQESGGETVAAGSGSDQSAGGAGTVAPAAAASESAALVGEASAAEIAGWKKSYPDGIFSVTVEDASIIYLKVPGIAEENNALTYAQRPNAQPLDYMEQLVNACAIGGDRTLLKDEQAMKSLMNVMRDKSNGKKVTLVNL